MSYFNGTYKAALEHIMELKFEDLSGSLLQLQKYSSLLIINSKQTRHIKLSAKIRVLSYKNC